MASFFQKGLERLVVWRVEETSLVTNPLHARQYAYQKNKSAENAISDCIHDIERDLDRGRMVITIDLDIKGAFDNVGTDAILRAMKKKNVDHEIITWYGDYLQHRTCQTKLGSSTIYSHFDRGGPQGGVASPLIAWCFPYEPLLEAFDGSSVANYGFADDTKLKISGIDFQVMYDTAQWALRVAQKWAKSIGVEFSADKTAVMFFNKGQYRPNKHLKMGRQILEWSRQHRYLGVIIDDRLTFEPHIDDKINAAKRKLMVLRKTFQNTWGPFPKASSYAYTGIVRPALTYGAVVWAKALKQKYIDKLKSLQRLALVQIANVRRSTPTSSLELIYNIPPLDLHILEVARKAYLRIGLEPDWVPNKYSGHRHQIYKSLPADIRGIKMDDSRSSIIRETNFEVIIGNGSDIDQRDWACYTDGSKIGKEGRTGSGGIILHRNKEILKISFYLGSRSVFQAEMYAILASAKFLLSYELYSQQIDILSDSQASLKALKNPRIKSDLVRDTKEALNKIGSTNDLKLHYIKAHVPEEGVLGSKYNELADALAKKGAKSNRRVELPKPSKRSVHSVIDELTFTEWSKRWENQPGHRQSKYFLQGPSKSRSIKFMELSREILGRIVRFLTGHAFLKRHNAIVAQGVCPPVGDVSCRICEDPIMEETPYHLITECEALCFWRSETMQQYITDEIPVWEPQGLIKFLSSKDLILLETEN